MKKYISPWIFTTNNCNLRCKYCYVKRKNDFMDDRTYRAINERFLNMIDEKKMDMVIYRLAGGEPLLAFDKWKLHIAYFLNYAGEKGFVSLITNLTILTDEMLNFMKTYDVGFGISLDSLKYSKPFADGSSSSSRVIKNIDRLIKHRGNKNLDISTVIDDKSFDDICDLAHWIADRDLNWGVYLDHFFCGEIDVKRIVGKMIEVINILDSYDYDICNKFKFNNIKVNSKYEGCTAGEKLVTIGLDGWVYPCQTAIYGESVSSVFGNTDILDDFKKQKKYKLGYNYTVPKECSSCSIIDICGGGCKLHNKEKNKNYTCDIMKHVLLYAMKIIVERS